MQFCATCGMPLENNEFIGLHNGDNLFCIYCIDDNKNIKTCEVIFKGGVQYFINEEGFSKEYAEKVVRKNMSILPYWQGNPSSCLKGAMLSDEEFHNLFCKQG